MQKQYTKSAYASFCPSAPLIVAGSAQWGLDDAFSSQQPTLEVRDRRTPTWHHTACKE